VQRRVGAEQRTERLRGDDRSDDIDVHLPAEFVGRQFKHGACHRDAGIVDQAGQGFAFQFGADVARRRRDRCLVGDVELQRREIGAELFP